MGPTSMIDYCVMNRKIHPKTYLMSTHSPNFGSHPVLGLAKLDLKTKITKSNISQIREDKLNIESLQNIKPKQIKEVRINTKWRVRQIKTRCEK